MKAATEDTSTTGHMAVSQYNFTYKNVIEQIWPKSCSGPPCFQFCFLGMKVFSEQVCEPEKAGWSGRTTNRLIRTTLWNELTRVQNSWKVKIWEDPFTFISLRDNFHARICTDFKCTFNRFWKIFTFICPLAQERKHSRYLIKFPHAVTDLTSTSIA